MHVQSYLLLKPLTSGTFCHGIDNENMLQNTADFPSRNQRTSTRISTDSIQKENMQVPHCSYGYTMIVMWKTPLWILVLTSPSPPPKKKPKKQKKDEKTKQNFVTGCHARKGKEGAMTKGGIHKRHGWLFTVIFGFTWRANHSKEGL